MHLLLALINFIAPPAQDCYLSSEIIDPRTHPQLKRISQDIAKDTGISVNDAQSYLSCSKKNSYTAKRNSNTQSPKSPFCQFNKRLVDPFRIKLGYEFYNTHSSELLDAYHQYGVDPYILTAIIGVESNYGRFTGNHLVKNTLATIIANTPSHVKMNPLGDASNHKVQNMSKQTFFIHELKALILMHINQAIDINTLKGSWDGGIGLPQFMPTSYIKHAKSKHNYHPDLFQTDDAILSAANYLKERGLWHSGHIAKPYEPSEEELALLANKTRIDYSSASDYTHIYRFEMNDGSAKYWLTGENFEAIRSYNPRPHYAINVFLLAEAIRERVNPNPEPSIQAT